LLLDFSANALGIGSLKTMSWKSMPLLQAWAIEDKFTTRLGADFFSRSVRYKGITYLCIPYSK